MMLYIVNVLSSTEQLKIKTSTLFQPSQSPILNPRSTPRVIIQILSWCYFSFFFGEDYWINVKDWLFSLQECVEPLIYNLNTYTTKKSHGTAIVSIYGIIITASVLIKLFLLRLYDLIFHNYDYICLLVSDHVTWLLYLDIWINHQ